MSNQHFDDLEADINDVPDQPEEHTDNNRSTKLERRRRIEDLFEERRLREELSEFELI
ncbi:PA3496 family putative envelope integrity protein [Legionella dresdenensis]|uniref:PA3496 family putative envelope integrity protein n=1 Tax=Legionella dresdenensis TaxID=450200 RepID=A0ABV8CHY4_9GAMM